MRSTYPLTSADGTRTIYNIAIAMHVEKVAFNIINIMVLNIPVLQNYITYLYLIP